jgi:hypothetical protein
MINSVLRQRDTNTYQVPNLQGAAFSSLHRVRGHQRSAFLVLRAPRPRNRCDGEVVCRAGYDVDRRVM